MFPGAAVGHFRSPAVVFPLEASCQVKKVDPCMSYSNSNMQGPKAKE